ncbi:hypothetical protein E4U37_004669 [Claviceps purpurea]|nr:hypothetical protein E4U37_004669 [Claviceps purpurea]
MYDYYVEEDKTHIYLIRMLSEDFMNWHQKLLQLCLDSQISHKLRRLVFEYFNQDSLAEDPLSEEERSADASEESFDASFDSSADNTFDDNQADALDEDTSNASVECSA